MIDIPFCQQYKFLVDKEHNYLIPGQYKYPQDTVSTTQQKLLIQCFDCMNNPKDMSRKKSNQYLKYKYPLDMEYN